MGFDIFCNVLSRLPSLPFLGLFVTCLLENLVKERGQPFSERTVLRWLHEQGFRYGRDCKGVFKDGHERPDVIETGSATAESSRKVNRFVCTLQYLKKNYFTSQPICWDMKLEPRMLKADDSDPHLSIPSLDKFFSDKTPQNPGIIPVYGVRFTVVEWVWFPYN